MYVMTEDAQFNLQLQGILELVYGWFCERGFPLSIQEVAISQYAEKVGQSENEFVATLREATHRNLFDRGQDYDVTPTLIAEYERRNPDDEKVKLNLEIRDLLHEKINRERRAGTDVINEDDVYNDPAFSDHDRLLILHNVEYLSKTESGIELAGQNGFLIVL